MNHDLHSFLVGPWYGEGEHPEGDYPIRVVLYEPVVELYRELRAARMTIAELERLIEIDCDLR